MKQANSKVLFELTSLQLIIASVLLSLIVLGGYFLGFQAGRTRGMDLAMEATEEYLVKLPIEVGHPDETKLAEVASKVYASLSVEHYDKKEPSSGTEDVMPLQPAVQKEADTKAMAPSSGTRSLGDRLNVKRKKKELSPSLEEESKDSKIAVEKKGNQETAVKRPRGPEIVDQGKIGKGWFVQVSAPAVKSEAQELANKLHESGFPVVVERAKVQKRMHFRVLVGPENTRLTAERLLQQLLRERYIDKAPFIRKMR